jgi:hypothetical protein
MENVPTNLKSGLGDEAPQVDGMKREFIATCMAFAMTYIEKGIVFADRYARCAGRSAITAQDIKIGLRYSMFENWGEDTAQENNEKMREYYEKMNEELRELETRGAMPSGGEEDENAVTDILEAAVGGSAEETGAEIEENDDVFSFANPEQIQDGDDRNFVRVAHLRLVAWQNYNPEDPMLQYMKGAIDSI